ncbi:hypothetical protein Dimus_020603, partial [Dionaea muscipula]
EGVMWKRASKYSERPLLVILASTSEVQKKKVVRTRKGKKSTTNMEVMEKEEIPTEGTVGDNVGDTQESQTMKPKKTKPPTKSQKKNTPSLTVRENLVETSSEDTQTIEDVEEDDNEKTESDEAVDEDAQAIQTSTVPIVNEEEGQGKKRDVIRQQHQRDQLLRKQRKRSSHEQRARGRSTYFLSLVNQLIYQGSSLQTCQIEKLY